MAKKRRAPLLDSETEAVKPSEVRAAISQKKLRSLLATAKRTQNDISELAGGLGAEVKDAVENHYLHRKAFNVCKQADRMEAEKLADFLDSLDHYLDISGLRDRASKVQRMNFGVAEEAEDEGEDEGGDRNVRAFPPPRGVAAE